MEENQQLHPAPEPESAEQLSPGAEAAQPEAPVEAEQPEAAAAPEPVAEPEPSDDLVVDSTPVPAEFLNAEEPPPADPDADLKAMLEAVVYITDEPLAPAQIAVALGRPQAEVERVLALLIEEFSDPKHGVTIREVAGGYKMGTKPEHHEAIRTFVKNLKPPLKLSLAALETLAVIAYKQPITAPEVMEVRGVSGAGVLKTLLDRKLITTAGRKNVVGKPILYKTTKDFLVQFGLKDLAELPTLKEFEELRRLALSDEPAEIIEDAPEQPASGQLELQPEGAEPVAETPVAEAPAEPAAEPVAEPAVEPEPEPTPEPEKAE